MEKSKVYFTSFKATGNENLLQKLHRLMKTAGSLLIINFFLTLSTTHLGELLLLLNA